MFARLRMPTAMPGEKLRHFLIDGGMQPVVPEGNLSPTATLASSAPAGPVEVALNPDQHMMRELIIHALPAFQADTIGTVWPSHLSPPSHIQPHFPAASLVVLEMPRLGAFCRWLVVNADIAGATERPGLPPMRPAPRPLSGQIPFRQTRSCSRDGISRPRKSTPRY
jgi:hypothetical protein